MLNYPQQKKMSTKKRNFADLKAELSRLTSLQSDIMQEIADREYIVSNPLFNTLLDIMPRCLIQICQDFLTFDICVKCKRMFPSKLGCLECKIDCTTLPCLHEPTECIIEQTEFFRVENFFWYDFSRMVFKDENCSEIWKYIEKTTIHSLHSMEIGIQTGQHLCALNLRIECNRNKYAFDCHHQWDISVEYMHRKIEDVA